MKVQYCSDLHLEFIENLQFIKKQPLKPKGEILILAGDIIPLSIIEKADVFFDNVSDNFEQVFWIPGNHEFYNYDLKNFSTPYKEKIRPNVFLLNNQQVEIKNVNFIFSTLWSYISERYSFIIQQSLNDFKLIKNKGTNLTVLEFNQLHIESLAFVKDVIKHSKADKNIVVTHHVPTLMNYPEHYRNSEINEAFAVELYDFIVDSNIAFWIYGHHHANISSFKIGKTEMLTNQLGYVKYNENKLFKRDLIFEI